jgi:Ca-activated chloride channel family protein
MGDVWAEFHFLRPWWLALLPVGVGLIWYLLRGRADGGGWRTVVDAPLRAHVLAEPEILRESRWPLVASLAAWLLAVIALAGPAWERLPVPAFRSEEALVVAFDLSRSMDATDVEPSRLARARLKLLDLLEWRSAGQTALVVFSTHAFTVTPLTTDTRTIAALAGAVNTDIMPTQGSVLSSGLEKAAALLRQTGLNNGEILAVTDADVTREDLSLAGDLLGEGYRVSVLAVGTEQGAPIAKPEGGFLTDDNGQVVIPQLDVAGLQRLAAAGGGRFARLAPDDRDLAGLFPQSALPASAALQSAAEQQEADVWLDRGPLLALALLPFLALSFRRGWLCGVLVLAAIPAPRADAFEWAELWQRPDQRGFEALQSNEAQRAAELFEDPQWRGAAEYRAGKFAESVASLEGIDTADGNYNRGNALAKAGRLEEAIGAYDRALELDANHEDAIHNRDLLKDFLEKNPEQQQPNEQQEGAQQNQQQADENGSSGNNDEANGDPSEQQGDQSQQQASESQSGEGQGSEDQPQPGEDDANGEQQQAANEQAEQQPQQGEAAGPQDVEQWASEQAAEQWLRRIPQDPGGLLRRKFQYQYQRFGVDQDGNSVLSDGPQKKPW